MDIGSLLAIIGVALCLLVLAVSSAADAALSAISRHRLVNLQHEDAPRAKLLNTLLNEPFRFKATLLCLNIAVVITATALTLSLTRGFPPGWQIGALALLLLVALVFGEAVPKGLVLRSPAEAARRLAGPMVWGTHVLHPLVWLADALARPLIRLLTGKPAPAAPLVSDEEVRLLVNVGDEEGVFEPEEREMIEGVISFGETVVREVMVPRVDIVALDATATLDEAIQTIIARGHSRIPVYEETIDQIIGILYAKDILPLLQSGRRDVPIRQLLRPPHFVPDLMKVDALLKDMKARKVHLAVVVDEYGGTAGIVTIEDLLEEIVGEIQDEYDAEEPQILVAGEGEVLADARVTLDDLNDLTGLHLESDESDRLGGLVYEKLGRVPQVGDRVELPDGVAITVLSVEGRGPRRLRVTFPPPGAARQGVPSEEAVGENPT